jgi:3-phenylpropionate/cinnamic acid dioxygenase small subunit
MPDDVIARCADELAVRNLIARIAILADQGDLEEYAQHFSEQAVWNFPPGPRHGRADILAGARERRAAGATGPGSRTRHVITNVAVSFDGPDTATADSYFLFVQGTTSPPTMTAVGAYHDRFVREGSRWRLARRDITSD